DRRGVHNVLWGYSTDVFDSKEGYLERYPGDAYVDVLGFDDYQSVRTPATRAVFARRLRDIVELAEARGKIPALTETGVEAVPDSLWWTGTLLAGIKSDSVARRIAWVLVWRNATFERERRTCCSRRLHEKQVLRACGAQDDRPLTSEIENGRCT